jgi:xanthine dehydrogenase accessory factor
MDIHRQIVDCIDAGRPFAVALVLQSDGSTPRKMGVKAVIDATGTTWGTIGGGAVEAEAQRQAVEACKSGRPLVFDLEFGGASAEADDPICGGAMRVLIDPTAAKDRASYAQAAEAAGRRETGILVTTVRTSSETEVAVCWLTRESAASATGFPAASDLRACLDGEAPGYFIDGACEDSARVEAMTEPIIPRPLLLIAGGGHVGQALARQAVLVGFDVTVLDDRPDFADPALFPEGVTCRCDDIAGALASTPIAGDTYIAIVTRSHKHDAAALAACIHSPAAYIGMIGSTRKVALVRKSFLGSGIATQEELDRVFAPIGLDIGAETVPEIATSITAELVAVRRKTRACRSLAEEVAR